MAEAHINRIHNTFIEFNFKTLNSDELKPNDFVDWAKKNVLEVIDQYANNLTDPYSIIKIPEIKIELNINVKNNFFSDDKELLTLINQKISSTLKKRILENQTAKISVQQHYASTVLEYIVSGQVDKYYTNQSWNNLIIAFFDELTANKQLYSNWQSAIQNKDAFVRFFKLRRISGIKEFIKKWLGEKDTLRWLKTVRKFFVENTFHASSLDQIDFYFKIFNLLSKNNMSLMLTLQHIIKEEIIQSRIAVSMLSIPKEIEQELSMIFGNNDIRKTLEVLIKKEQYNKRETYVEQNVDKHNIKEILDKGTYVGQAGLVLLAPFLPLFLKNIGYINSKKEIIKQREIPILLHYIATGETTMPEWKLTLPKILAGLKPGQYCDTDIKPDKKLNSYIEDLLSSVIEHWDALKNTSSEGLRDAFLIREGTLKFKNGFYYLYVKAQTLDILLSFISWNYTMVKFDWMQDILFVEWNKS